MGAPDALRTAAVVDPRRGTALLRHPLDLLLQPVRRLRIGLLHHVVRRTGRTLRAAEARNGGRVDHRALDPRKNRSGLRDEQRREIDRRPRDLRPRTTGAHRHQDLHRVLHLRPDLRRLHPAHRTLRPDLRRPGRQRNAIDRRLDDDDHGHGRHGPADGAHPAAAAHLHPLLPDRLAQTQRARHADRLPCSGS